MALAARFVASRSSAVRGAAMARRLPLRGAGRGGAAPPPPFVRLRKPNEKLNAEHELLWDDGVAPELCIDFDASHVPAWEGAKMWLMGLGFYASLFAGT